MHEEDYPMIQEAMREPLGQVEVLGLVFHMLHFKGTIGRWTLDVPQSYAHRAQHPQDPLQGGRLRFCRRRPA